MLRHVSLALMVSALPAAVLAQAAAPASETESVSLSQVSAQLDKDYAALDSNKDGKASRAEIEKRIADQTKAELAEITSRREASFKKLDTNGDGSVSKAEFEAGVPLPTAAPVDAAPVLARFDANKDGTITATEFRAPTLANFNALDANKDGVLSAAERQKKASSGR